MKRRTFIKRIGLLFAAVIVPKSLVEHTIKDRAKPRGQSSTTASFPGSTTSSSSSKSSWSTATRSTSSKGESSTTSEVWAREMIKEARKPSVWAAFPNTKLTMKRRRM